MYVLTARLFPTTVCHVSLLMAFACVLETTRYTTDSKEVRLLYVMVIA